ncbi:hypothetical protein, partial [Candidatus Cyrtobacter comes]|uniref:hypothetical protein n=1 Tax=Candidatus Cyrtobacter comes TaxID=675776 RepID=UPI002ACE2B31
KQPFIHLNTIFIASNIILHLFHYLAKPLLTVPIRVSANLRQYFEISCIEHTNPRDRKNLTQPTRALYIIILSMQ